MSERTRVAAHEASHAAMAYVLGSRVELVSIRRTRRWDGIASSRPRIASAAEDFDVDLPLPMWPPDVRHHFEAEILVALAGPLGERLFAAGCPGFDGAPATADERLARDRVRLLAPAVLEPEPLSDDAEALIAAGEGEGADPTRADHHLAREAAWVLDGRETEILLDYLRAQTRRIVAGTRFARLVGALVPLLLEHESLGGEDVRAIFDSHDSERRSLAHDHETQAA